MFFFFLFIIKGLWLCEKSSSSNHPPFSLKLKRIWNNLNWLSLSCLQQWNLLSHLLLIFASDALTPFFTFFTFYTPFFWPPHLPTTLLSVPFLLLNSLLFLIPHQLPYLIWCKFSDSFHNLLLTIPFGSITSKRQTKKTFFFCSWNRVSSST